MSEIFGAIRLKDRIIIVTIMLAYALLLAGTAGAVTMASLSNHIHDYGNYYIERGEDGQFDYVGVCSKPNCDQPKYVRDILEGVTSKITTEPTCTEEGVVTYTFVYQGKSYTSTESVPSTGHRFECEITTENGVSNVKGHCTAKDCSEELSIVGVTDLALESTTPGTCVSSKEDKYTYTLDGVTGSFVAVSESDEENHILNGRPISEFMASNGVVIYGTEGVTIPDGVQLSGCGQKTLGAYTCEGCNEAVPTFVGLPEHNYLPVDGTLKPADFDVTGQVNVKCNNKGCASIGRVNLPKAGDASVTLTIISIDEENEKQTWKYSYYSEKYNVTIEYEFVSDWVHDHVFVHDSTLTTPPTLTANGVAVVKCSVDGCNEAKQVVLPKVQIQIGQFPKEGDNAVYINEFATEQKAQTVRYTYTSTIYGFTEVIEIETQKPLDHNYSYYLELAGDNYFVVKAICKQPECQNPEYVKEENVKPNYVNTSTCTQFGEQIWSHPTDESVKPLIIPSFELMGHDIRCGNDDIVEKPGTTKTGLAIAKCVNHGCTEKLEITLPKVVFGEDGNTTVLGIDNDLGIQIILYSYTHKEGDLEIPVYLETVLEEPHVHEHKYELVPMEGGDIGKFDFVGTCYAYSVCGERTVEKDVAAKLIADNSTCTGGIKQSWAYTRDGVMYYCNLDIDIPDGHHMDFDIKASTTIRPTLTEKGSLEIFCTKCGERQTIDLPVLVPGVNATLSEETDKQISYLYKYFYVYNEFDPDGHFTVELLVEIIK